MASLKLPPQQVLRTAGMLSEDNGSGKGEDLYYDVMSSISKTVINYRHKHNLTGKQLADKAGITTSVMSRVESGNQNISLKTICKVLAVMDKTLTIK